MLLNNKILKNSNSDLLNTLINDLDKDLNLNYDSKITLNSKHTIELLKLYGEIINRICAIVIPGTKKILTMYPDSGQQMVTGKDMATASNKQKEKTFRSI